MCSIFFITDFLKLLSCTEMVIDENDLGFCQLCHKLQEFFYLRIRVFLLITVLQIHVVIISIQRSTRR